MFKSRGSLVRKKTNLTNLLNEGLSALNPKYGTPRTPFRGKTAILHM